MSIQPIRQSVVVRQRPARAFELFCSDIGRWWPRGMTVGASPHADIVIEPHVGGRWFERAEDGQEIDWGRILAWEPPGRLLLAWQLDAGFKFDPEFETEVELTFLAEGEGQTRVTLEHRNLERFGPSAAQVAAQLGGGWPGLVENYQRFADTGEMPAPRAGSCGASR